MQCSSFIEISISIEFPVFQENRKIQDRKTGKYRKTGNSIDIEISINDCLQISISIEFPVILYGSGDSSRSHNTFRIRPDRLSECSVLTTF